MAEITKADELRLVQARKASPYIRTPQEDGVDYPIPELEGASRKILVDRDTMHSTMCTWGYTKPVANFSNNITVNTQKRRYEKKQPVHNDRR